MLRCVFLSVVVAALVLGVAACSGQGAPGDEDVEGMPLYFEPIGQGLRANLSDTTELVVRDRASWLPISDSLRPSAPFDSVDFDQSVVLIAALPQTTSGYTLEFTSVEERDSVVVAEYLVSAPSDDCLTGHAEVVPFQVIQARRTELPVEFVRSVEEYRCTFGPRR